MCAAGGTGAQKIYLSWDAPKCADGCSDSWLGDGMCDKACNVSSCFYDVTDCVNKTTYDRGGGSGSKHNKNKNKHKNKYNKDKDKGDSEKDNAKAGGGANGRHGAGLRTCAKVQNDA